MLLSIASPTLAAVKLEQSVAVNLLTNFQNSMNSKNPEDIASFINFYASVDSRFHISSEFYDSNQLSEALAKEELDLNRDEYIAFLQKNITDSIEHGFLISITQFTKSNDGNSALLSTQSKEYTKFKKDDRTQLHPTEQYSNMNCNINLITSSTDVQINSMNCLERITRYVPQK